MDKSPAPPAPPITVVQDPWTELRRYTDARIALGRAGHALPTGEVLHFQLSHAQARDAVHRAMDFDALEIAIAALGLRSLRLHSRAADRATYLKRPDLGRLLDAASEQLLEDQPESLKGFDLALVVGDGLSALGVETNVPGFLAAALPALATAGITVCPLVCLADQARVALSDEVGERLRARAVVILIGERPGLSSPDSLGLYLTFGPRRGLQNADRNCISNVRPAGLSGAEAAQRLAWLVRESLRRGVSGVTLEDLSDRPPLPPGA